MTNIDLSNVIGASYAGSPENNTMMYITKKVEHLVKNLRNVSGCVVFVDLAMEIESEIENNNTFIRTNNPQFEYAKCATDFWKKQLKSDKARGYRLTEEGYYIGKNVSIGKNAYIEPGVFIGHDVVIGDNAIIMTGAVIKHAIIGNDFLCNENAVIGDYGFTMAENENGDKCRIPTIGRVVIGNNVEVGACADIAMGACGDTILEDCVKIDALVHVGHEAHLKQNVVVTAGAIVGGFAVLEERAYLGINSTVKNRVNIEENCLIGMGANVVKSTSKDTVMIGNPAKPKA